jgi:hypothetical protein
MSKLLLAGLLLTSSPTVHAGTIWLTSTPSPDHVVVNITVDDTGDQPACPYLVLKRGDTDVFYIERQFGVTTTHQFVDTNVKESTLYCYTMDLRMFPAPVPCTPGAFCLAFECFYQIMTCVNTGPDPAFIGHGLLSEFYPGGGEVDHNEANAILYDCEDPNRILLELHQIPAEAEPYLDSGESVAVYGTWLCCWAQGIWLLNAQLVVPRSCVIAVEESTWGRVKSFYRD